MADINQKAAPAAAETPTTEAPVKAVETPKISKEVADKYDMHACIQPCRMDFGTRFGNVQMDMRTVTVAEVDAFVKRFDKQHYFKEKKK